MTPITINIECMDRTGFNMQFCTVVASVEEVHKALMDCINAIDRMGLKYRWHTIAVNWPRSEKKTEEVEDE